MSVVSCMFIFKQRGKFRPRLTELVQTNSKEEVKSASIKAFKALPDISAAISALTVLKAVGPATASGTNRFTLFYVLTIRSCHTDLD